MTFNLNATYVKIYLHVAIKLTFHDFFFIFLFLLIFILFSQSSGDGSFFSLTRVLTVGKYADTTSVLFF